MPSSVFPVTPVCIIVIHKGENQHYFHYILIIQPLNMVIQTQSAKSSIICFTISDDLYL